MYKGASEGGRQSMEPHARQALEWAEEHRIVEPRMFEDIKTDLEHRRDTLFGYVNGQRAIRWTEEKTRTQAFMTFYELLRERGLDRQETLNLAADMTRHTMVDYRPFEKPLIYQNLGIIGDMISPLTTFKHNYYSQMAVGIKDLQRSGFDPKYAVPIVVALVMQQILSGLLGIPGREDADTIIGWAKDLGIMDPDSLDLTQVILQSENPSYITHGVSALTGLDMSPTFSAASVIPERASELMPLVSKAGDIGKATFKALSDRTQSSANNLLHNLLPNSLQGIQENYMMEGDVVPNFENRGKGTVHRSDADAMKRNFGLRGIDEAKERTKMFKEQQNEKRIIDKRSKLVERALDSYKSGDNVDSYIKEAARLGMSPRDFLNSLKELDLARKTTDKERFQGLKPKSFNQMNRIQRLQRYE